METKSIDEAIRIAEERRNRALKEKPMLDKEVDVGEVLALRYCLDDDAHLLKNLQDIEFVKEILVLCFVEQHKYDIDNSTHRDITPNRYDAVLQSVINSLRACIKNSLDAADQVMSNVSKHV